MGNQYAMLNGAARLKAGDSRRDLAVALVGYSSPVLVQVWPPHPWHPTSTYRPAFLASARRAHAGQLGVLTEDDHLHGLCIAACTALADTVTWRGNAFVAVDRASLTTD